MKQTAHRSLSVNRKQFLLFVCMIFALLPSVAFARGRDEKEPTKEPAKITDPQLAHQFEEIKPGKVRACDNDDPLSIEPFNDHSFVVDVPFSTHEWSWYSFSVLNNSCDFAYKATITGNFTNVDILNAQAFRISQTGQAAYREGEPSISSTPLGLQVVMEMGLEPQDRGVVSVLIRAQSADDPITFGAEATTNDPTISDDRPAAYIADVIERHLDVFDDSNILSGITGDDDNYTFITTNAEMPALLALPSLDLDVASAETVSWILNIAYTRGGRNDSDRYFADTSAGVGWEPAQTMGDDVRGGEAVLYYTIPTADGDIRGQFYFRIRAHNPIDSDVVQFIDANITDDLWWVQYVAKSETFSAAGIYNQFNPFMAVSDLADGIAGTPNASGNGDGGYGIMQLTNPQPSAQQIWSWKDNVLEGIELAEDKQMAAETAYATHLSNANGTPIPFTINYGNTCSFRENPTGNQESFVSAIAMKRYNGNAGGDFVEWESGTWQLNNLNNEDPPFNYVERVCNHWDE